MDVYQCPECELKFRFASELIGHLATDHPGFQVDDRTVEDSLLSASHLHRHHGQRRPHREAQNG